MTASASFFSKFGLSLALWLVVGQAVHAVDKPRLELQHGNKIVLIGNALAERMQYFGHWETLLHSRFPQLELVVRNLAWPADELELRPRSGGFQDHGHRLDDHKPDVIIAAFGFNESFAGPAGLAKFQSDLEKFILQTTSTKYNDRAPPQLVLLSPIANENLKQPGLAFGTRNNDQIKLYADALAAAAEKHGLVFVDLFTPSRQQMEQGGQPLTTNGIHLNELGNAQVGALLDESLFGPRSTDTADLEKLRAEVNEKNLQHFYDFRAVNGCYIYGERKAPFGVVNFPPEFTKLRQMIANRDQRVWSVAQGKPSSVQIDDSNTLVLPPVETNVPDEIKLTTPAESLATFKLADGYEANLFASEVEFPDLQNPVACAFNAHGRLWVSTMSTYPMYLPGKPVHDKILILEDTNADGRADKQTVFADGLHLPTGFELGHGGVYVGQEPNILFLKDTDGDDKADTREIVLEGFDSADSHHAVHAFTWEPGSALDFQEGIFLFSQVESPYGPVRNHDGGIYRYEPRTQKLAVFASYPFFNPWGHYVDRWGQDLVSDASDGSNYFGTAFACDSDYPDKCPGMPPFFKTQWRPTCACALISSRNFPDEVQGDYLVNNCIGFQGVLHYKLREDGSGFAADPAEPLLQSSDRSFRPTDMEFAPDGSLYLVDWFNPLIGHMQHSLRDPKRDTSHGRIWRIRHKDRPLVEPAKIAGVPIPALLALLTTHEDRTRYRARTELHDRDPAQAMPELASWLAALDKNDANYWHNMLEGLWLYQAYDVINVELLATLLRCDEPRARAAATRVLCAWRDRIDDPLALLKVQAGDEHPRVRLEALRAASFFRGKDLPAAQEVAIETLLQDQDRFLEYTLNETTRVLDKRLQAEK